MSRPKHTPGPWSVFRSGRGNGTTLGIVRRHAGRLIDIVLDVEGATLTERRANARVLAASLKMAEALQKIARYPESRLDEMSISKAREIARTALASVGVDP